MGFGIKVPMFPFHTWLPDAHTEAPTQGSVILAAVLLKLGTYGFVRIAIPILPEAARVVGSLASASWPSSASSTARSCCLAQTDMKRLIAFSSVAHMGFVMLGIATLTTFGINAAIFGMVAHGLITGMLFFIAGSVKERYHTLEIKRLGGLLLQAPRMGWILGFCAHGVARAARPRRILGRVPGHPVGLPTGVGAIGRVVPRAHGGGGHRHGVRRRLPAVAAAAHRVRRRQGGVRGTTTSPTCMCRSTSRGPRCSSRSSSSAWSPTCCSRSPTPRSSTPPSRRSEPDSCTCSPPAASWTQPNVDYHAIAPEIVLTGAIVVILLADLMLPERRSGPRPPSPARTAGGRGPVITLAVDGADRSLFGGAYAVDNFALALKAVFLAAGYVVVLLSANYVEEGDFYQGEYYFLLLSSLLGMLVMASARDFVSMFVALETCRSPRTCSPPGVSATSRATRPA